MILHVLNNFAVEASADAGGLSSLGIDGKAFIIQLVTWLLVFFVLAKFVFRPIINVLQKRQETITKGVELTSEMIAQKEKLDKEVEKVLKKARSEANEILSKTHDQSNAMIKEAEEKASQKVDAMIAEAKVKIADETAKAKRNLEKEVVNLVIEATEVVSGEKLDARKDADLLAKALKAKA